jgi:hypothetical protein
VQPLNLTALAAALPPGTPVIQNGSQVQIGNSFECNDDATPFAGTVQVTRVTGVDAQGHETTENAAVENWPTGVTSAEQMVAFAYYFATLQTRMGDAYAAAAAGETLPTWSPGLALPD